MAAAARALLAAACVLAASAADWRRSGLRARGPNLLDIGNSVHGNISDYYIAAGADDALPEGLKSSRVASKGTLHLFYLPHGLSGLELGAAVGGRRASVSALQRLRERRDLVPMSDGFPEYHLSDSYKTPLTAAGQAAEAAAVGALAPSQLMVDIRSVADSPTGSTPTRSYSNPSATQAIATMLQETLQGMGFATCTQSFTLRSAGAQSNIIAFKPGSIADSVTLGAHYDSRPFQGLAPGAVDNGSGVAVLLSAARAFASAGISPRKSVYFVAFGAEEPGIIGSEEFAKALQSGSLPQACRSAAAYEKAGPARHQAIVMDEVAWRSPNLPVPTVNLEAFDWASDVLESLAQASHSHNGNSLKVIHSNYPFGSDHMSFSDQGNQAVLTIQGDDTGYPDYHRSTDSVANINEDLLTMIAKMNLGGLVRLSGVE